MGCPIHIWAPLMTGLIPVARIARDRLHLVRTDRASQAKPARAVRRFAPIAPGGASDASKATTEA